MPHFHYDPTLYSEVPDTDPDATLSPGPNSPVGRVWIALSKPHYGMHGTPDPDFTKRVQLRAQEAGLLLLTCGVHANVVRFLFPLTTEDSVFEEGLALLAQALEG